MTSQPIDAPADRGHADDGQPDLPQFASVMRGYDRGQVDDYVARLIDFLGDAEQRANRAERGLADAQRRTDRLSEELRQAIERQQQGPSVGEPYEGLGERIESILRLAAEEADALRERGRSDAAEMVDQARRQREQEVQAAERDLAAVARRRDEVVAELRKVQDVLATLGLRQALAEGDPAALPVTDELARPAAPETGGRQNTDDDADTSADADETTVINLHGAERSLASG